jgi:hypothetical protein
MRKRHLLFSHQVVINDYLHIEIPTVGQVIDNEDDYYSTLALVTSSPYDMMVQLDDMGIDFTEITEYELFLVMFHTIAEQDTSMLFGDLDLSKFKPVIDQSGDVLLRDSDTGYVIDIALYNDICTILRQIHGLERHIGKPVNEATKKYIIDRARKKMKRRLAKGGREDSQLESLIVAYVNAEQTSFTFDEVRDMTIYQFNESLKQVIKKVDYNNRMHGIYSGTVSAKDMSRDDLNWLTHNKQ